MNEYVRNMDDEELRDSIECGEWKLSYGEDAELEEQLEELKEERERRQE